MSEEERREHVRLLECSTSYARRHPLPAELADKLGASAQFSIVDSIVAIGRDRCMRGEPLDTLPDGGECGASERRVMVYVDFDGVVEPLRAAGLEGGMPSNDTATGQIEVRHLCELAGLPGVRHVDLVPEAHPN
jgi:hypothetical protein